MQSSLQVPLDEEEKAMLEQAIRMSLAAPEARAARRDENDFHFGCFFPSLR